MFINFTNHNSDLWSAEQRMAAEEYGDITDIAFPSVDPAFGSEMIYKLAEKYTEMICEYKPDAVLVQGEMTLTYEHISLCSKMICVHFYFSHERRLHISVGLSESALLPINL